MKILKSISLNPFDSPIEGQTILQVGWGNPARPNCPPYSAIYLTMTSGRVFVITQCYGEVSIDEVVEQGA